MCQDALLLRTVYAEVLTWGGLSISVIFQVRTEMRICFLAWSKVKKSSTRSLLTFLVTSRPMKKKSGVIAGIARAGGGRDSPVGYGHMDDNEDVRQKTFPTFSFSTFPT